MKCYCCGSEVTHTYHVKLRGDVRVMPDDGFKSPQSLAFQSYRQNATFRSAFICPHCYGILDSVDGTGEIGDRTYGLDGKSRGGKAALYDEAKYQKFQRKQAAKLGIELGGEDSNDSPDVGLSSCRDTFKPVAWLLQRWQPSDPSDSIFSTRAPDGVPRSLTKPQLWTHTTDEPGWVAVMMSDKYWKIITPSTFGHERRAGLCPRRPARPRAVPRLGQLRVSRQRRGPLRGRSPRSHQAGLLAC